MSYNDKLKEISIDLNNIFLDPNNPRFSDNKGIIPENKIINLKIQNRILKKMEEFDLDSLIKNIENNGFLKIDRIIVKKIKGTSNNYVVIEGNRRIASLKKIQEESLDDDLINTIKNIDVLLYEGDNNSITWFLQGIRHISGIKEWSPYQQAVLLEKTIKEEKLNITKAGEKYGLGRQISARLLRTLYSLNNFKEDDEYGEYAKNSHFSIFEELLKKPKLKDYFGWSDNDSKFKNENEIKTFYEWIQRGIINSAVDDVRKKLPIIISSDDGNYIEEITEGNMSLDDAYISILSDLKNLSPEELDKKFKNIIKELDNIPSKSFTDKTQKSKLEKNLEILDKKIKELKKLCQ